MNPLDISLRLFDHYESVEEVKNYFGLLAMYALVRTAEEKNDTNLLERCLKMLRRYPDEIVHPRYNFFSYKIGGIPKAYAHYRHYLPEASQQIRMYAEEAMQAPRDSNGILKCPYEPEKNLIWIDAALPVPPFLLYAGLALDEKRYVDEAVHQTILLYDAFRNPENGLLHQTKNFVGPDLLSEDHWSRGNGWGFIALTELVQHLPVESEHRPIIEQYFIDHASAMLPYQSRRGLWRQEIPLQYAYEESSGTALILYGYGVGMCLGLLDKEHYYPAFANGIDGLFEICINEDFSTEMSCPGCRCPGEGDEAGTVMAYVTQRLPYRDEHHSFGPLMLAMVEAYKNGITDLIRDPEKKKRRVYGQRSVI